jgi:hypothetical protein
MGRKRSRRQSRKSKRSSRKYKKSRKTRKSSRKSRKSHRRHRFGSEYGPGFVDSSGTVNAVSSPFFGSEYPFQLASKDWYYPIAGDKIQVPDMLYDFPKNT